MDDLPDDAVRVDGLRGRLRSSLVGEVAQHVGLEEAEAEAIATAVLDHAVVTARAHLASPFRTDHYLSPSTTILTWWRQEISAALACARATELCPGGSSWWLDEGIPVLAFLLDGEATYAATEQAEILAGPYDRSVDFNWPGTRVVDRYPELQADTSFLAGDWEGNRARYRIVESEGRLYAEMEKDSWFNPTETIWLGAWDELTKTLDLEDAKVRDCARWFSERGITMVIDQTVDGWLVLLLDASGAEVERYGPGRSRGLVAEEAAMQFPWRKHDHDRGAPDS